MADALEKLKRLEKYLAAGHSAADPVLEMTLDKLLAREIAQTRELQTRLKNQLTEFERQHALPSDTFHARYQNGDLGDETDFIEWSATIGMLANAEERLTLLERGSEA